MPPMIGHASNCSGPHREAASRVSPYHGPMKIGLVLPMSDADGPGAGAWPRLKQLAQLAEAGGIDSLWLYDHLIFRFPDEDEDGPPRGDDAARRRRRRDRARGAGHDRPGHRASGRPR